jgi:stalled ribosome rescue protein Dom34
MGSYHSIELAVGRKFKLQKAHWDFMAFERLNTSTDVRSIYVCALQRLAALSLWCFFAGGSLC